MQDRQKQILKAIINEFIQTAQPVGSKSILVSYNFDVSAATVRNEMAKLEKEGLIAQPHISAGRIPTDLGYRVFVNDIVDFAEVREQAKETIKSIQDQFKKNQIKRKVQEAVSVLSLATTNVGFATLPESRTFYLGLSNVLKKPEFLADPMQASQVVEVLENNNNFLEILKSLNISHELEIFIGKENLLEQIQSCGMIIGKYKIDDYEGYIGLLGPTRMNYPYNSVVLQEVLNLILIIL
jgi:heat-inducible transcriptional repressor